MTGRGKFLNEKIERLPRKDLIKLQTEGVRKVFQRARERSSFYRNFLEEKGCENVQIKTLEDVQRIPLMSKKEARGAFPDKLLLVEKEEVREVHATSGTTGKPVYTFATRRDLERWAERNGRSLWAMGFRPGDSFMVLGMYGLSSGGLGYHYGCQHINLFVIPTEVGQAQKKVEMIEKVDALAKHILENIDCKETIVALTADHTTSSLKKAHSGEPVPVAIMGPSVRIDDVKEYGERTCAKGGLGRIVGRDLMPILLNLIGKGDKAGS